MTTNSDTGRLFGADFMRAAACLVVLFHHLAQRLDQGEIAPALEVFRTFSSNGTFGVAVFFVLSGFLLARPFWFALDRGQPMPSLRTYAIRRAARILPGFWLALTVTFIATITIFGPRLDGELLLRFAAGFLLLADWHWITFFPVDINGPLWSISFEATSYVLLPICFALLFCIGMTGWRTRIIWLGIIALVLAGHWLIANFVTIDEARRGWHFGLPGGANIWMPKYNPLAFFAMFAIGSFAAGFQVRWGKVRGLIFDALALAGLSACVWIFVAYAHVEDASAYGWLDIPYDFPWLVLAVGLVLASAPSSLYVGRILDNRVSRYIAGISFGIYVWHYLVIEIVRKYGSPDFDMFSVKDPAMFVATSIAITALTFLVAHLSFHFMERPIMLWARGREGAQAATLSPAAG